MDDFMMILIGIPLVALVWVMSFGLIYLVYLAIKDWK